MANFFDGSPVEPAASSQDGTSQPAPEAAVPTCRICRGPAEPLLSPCKCTGSIKFVHAKCLKAWRSYSKKEYCDVCKKRFNYTKEYDPNMPPSLPMRVCFPYMAKRLFWNVVAWLRAILAIIVSVGWLPYFIRGVWTFMFRVSNEGLESAISISLFGVLVESKWPAVAMNLGEKCLATPLLAPTTTSAKLVELAAQNSAKHSGFTFALSSINVPTAVKPGNPQGWLSLNSREPETLLSKLPFFHDLTRSHAVNRTIIAILEGQIITVLIAIGVVLVILLLDNIWQQEAINGQEDEGAVTDLGIPPAVEPGQHPDVAAQHRHDPAVVPGTNTAAADIPNPAGPGNEAPAGEAAPTSLPRVALKGPTVETSTQPLANRPAGADAESVLVVSSCAPSLLDDAKPRWDHAGFSSSGHVYASGILELDSPSVLEAVADAAGITEVLGPNLPPLELGHPAPGPATDNERNGADGEPSEPIPGAAEIVEREDAPVGGGQRVPVDPGEFAMFNAIMMLIGTRGPIIGFFKMAILHAIQLSAIIFVCIFVPYNIGRLSFWIVANPALIAKVLFAVCMFIQDALILILAWSSWLTMNLVEMCVAAIQIPFRLDFTRGQGAMLAIWRKASVRVATRAVFDFRLFAAEWQNFSVTSHEALYKVKEMLAVVVIGLITGAQSAYTNCIRHPGMHTLTAIQLLAQKTLRAGVQLFKWPLSPELWLASSEAPASSTRLNPSLANWSAADQFWAIIAGYMAIFSALYLNRNSTVASSGCMKVIFLMSITGLVFPFYCGILLNIALLPLSDGATLSSRWSFTSSHAINSAFVHFLVGQCYLIYLARFMAMCRKLLRPGVLYLFIDPDDLEFSPIQEMLEDKLTTQLRSILSSAFIHGGLMLSVRSIAWSVYMFAPSAFPIHCSSNELCLTFLARLLWAPLVFNLRQPAAAIYIIYTWWFRRCARGLRLTYFMFGERRIDEEGTLHLPADSEHTSTVYSQYFLGLDDQNRVVPRTWRNILEGSDSNRNPNLSENERQVAKDLLVNSGQLVKDGRFVRAPTSNGYKSTKGSRVFLDVSERNVRTDKTDAVDEADVYDSDAYKVVYLPPSFRTRALLFGFSIWLFVVVTSVGVGVLALVLGRIMFQVLHVHTKGIYSFIGGIYLLRPIALAAGMVKILLSLTRVTTRVVDNWTADLRDEMYLIGEQLQNFEAAISDVDQKE